MALFTDIAEVPADIAAVKALFEEYLQVLKTDFKNQIGCAAGNDDMCGFPDAYTALFLASLGGMPIAACGLKHINDKDAELGKLYCRPEGRGQAAGRALTEASIQHARTLGYTRLVLSTEPVMKHAVALYTDMGFETVENYACGGGGCSQFMALNI